MQPQWGTSWAQARMGKIHRRPLYIFQDGWIYYLCLSVWPVCLSVHHVCAVPTENRKGCWFPEVVVHCHVGAGNRMKQRKSCSNFTGLLLIWPWFVTVDGWGRCPSVLCSHLRDSSSKLISRQTWRLPPVLHILLHMSVFLSLMATPFPNSHFLPSQVLASLILDFFFFKKDASSVAVFFFSQPHLHSHLFWVFPGMRYMCSISCLRKLQLQNVSGLEASHLTFNFFHLIWNILTYAVDTGHGWWWICLQGTETRDNFPASCISGTWHCSMGRM